MGLTMSSSSDSVISIEGVCPIVFGSGRLGSSSPISRKFMGSDSKVSSEERKLEFHWRAIFRELE